MTNNQGIERCIEILQGRIDHHSDQETMADAMDFVGSAKYHENMRKELEEMQRQMQECIT